MALDCEGIEGYFVRGVGWWGWGVEAYVGSGSGLNWIGVFVREWVGE